MEDLEKQELRCTRCGQSLGSTAEVDKHNREVHRSEVKETRTGTRDNMAGKDETEIEGDNVITGEGENVD